MSARIRHAAPAALLAIALAAILIVTGVGQAEQGTGRLPARASAGAAASAGAGARITPLPAGIPVLTARPLAAAVSPVRLHDAQARRGALAARLRRPVLLRTAPGGKVIARIGTTTGYDAPRVLAIGAVRPGWLGVRTLQRTDGQLAWIPADAARLRHLRTLLVVDLSERRLTLRVGGRITRTAPVGVGRPGSPTPIGRYGVADRLTAYGSAYGCCILTLTGHQQNLPAGWTGGTRIALHGTPEPGSVGHEVSAGCLRMRDEDIKALIPHVPLGTTLVVRE